MAVKFNDNTYTFLKRAAMYWIPAVGTLYASLSVVWGLPHSEQVVATLMAIDTALGAMLGLSTSAYNTANPPVGPQAGNIVVDTTRPNQPPQYSFQFEKEFEEIAQLGSIVLNVVHAKPLTTMQANIQAPSGPAA